MKLEELVRDHIDSAALPVTLDEVRQHADSQTLGGLQAISILDPDVDLTWDPASSAAVFDPISGRISQPAADGETDRDEAVQIKRGVHLGFWLQAAAVLVAVAVSATAMLWYRGGRSTNIDTASTPEAQAAAALATVEEAANATNRGWTQIDDPNGVFLAPDITELVEVDRLGRYGLGWGQTANIFHVSNIQHLSSGYYAVGSHNDELISKAAIWHSPDAKTWTQILGAEQDYEDWELGNIFPGGTGLIGIAEHDETIVAVGWTRSTSAIPTVWAQTTEDDWQRIHLPLPSGFDSEAWTIVANDEGFLASGQAYDAQGYEGQSNAVFWRSSDGLLWELVETSGVEHDSQVYDLATVGPTTVAVGSIGGWDGAAAAWISIDGGTTWTPSRLPEASIGLPVSAMSSLAVGPEGLLAIGNRSSQEAQIIQHDDSELLDIVGTIQLTVWTSLDGREWVEHPGPSDSRGHEMPHSVEWGPAGFLITSTSVWLDGFHGSSWLTVDGGELTRLGDPRDVNASAIAHVATPDGYITLADPEFHFTTGFSGEDSDPGKASHRLEVWELEVANAGG